MSETNDMKAAAVDDEQPPLGDNGAEVTGAESPPPTNKVDSRAERMARAGYPNKKRSGKLDRKRSSKADKRKDDGAASASPPTLRERLLASIKLPPVRIDSRSLPSELHNALDAAGLADTENLPTATFCSLAVVAAVAGPDITCAIEKPLPGLSMPGGLSLRLGVVTEERVPILVPPCILGAAYAAESDALDVYATEVEKIERLRRSNEQLRRVREQAERAGIDLGADAPQSDAMLKKACPRPRIVIVNGAVTAIRAAAAGGTGILVINDRRLPWLASVDDNYDFGTDSLLNMAAAGYPIPIEDPTNGSVNMRSIPVSVIGAIDLHKCDSLNKANRAQLEATVFMPVSAPHPGGNNSKLDRLLRRIHKMGLQGLKLRLRGDSLASAAEAWTSAATEVRPPLAHFLANAPDLARRLAVAMHLTATDGSAANCAIPAKTAAQAVGLVDEVVLPVARALLGPCSVPQVENDARRVVGNLRVSSSPVNRLFERRVLLRAWQRTMPAVRLDRALALLVEAELLVDKDGGGRVFEVAPAVFGEM